MMGGQQGQMQQKKPMKDMDRMKAKMENMMSMNMGMMMGTMDQIKKALAVLPEQVRRSLCGST